MENRFDYTLNVHLSDDSNATINVLDIVESFVYKKKFIIYTFEGENKTIFASIIKDYGDFVNLEKIESEDEINFINNEINRVCEGEIEYGL